MSAAPEHHPRQARAAEVAQAQASSSRAQRLADRADAVDGRPTTSVVPDDRLRPLTAAETTRYARHLLLPQVADEGQRRIRAAKVLVVGLGGLGSPVALYLVAAGVGAVGLADLDTVDESNLQRQVVHGTPDVGRPKVGSAADRLAALNPGVRLVRHPAGLTGDNARTVVAGYDVVVDCTDSFTARYLLNDACVALGTPLVHGAVHQLTGQVSVLATATGPCYRCLHPEPPAPDPGEVGVLGALPGIVGAVQAAETLKLVVGGPTLVGRLLLVDAWTTRFDEVPLTKDPSCPVCGALTA